MVHHLKIVINALDSTLMCDRCGWKRPYQEHNIFYDLSIPLPNVDHDAHKSSGGGSIKLEECLKSLFYKEVVEGVECLNCTLIRELTRASQDLSVLSGLIKDAPGHAALGLELRLALEKREVLKCLLTSLSRSSQEPSTEDLSVFGISDSEKVRTSYSKYYMVSRWPAVLCFHLQRLYFNSKSYTMQKNRVIVDFPFRLRPTGLMNMKIGVPPLSCEYDLKAVIVHHGTSSCGIVFTFNYPFAV